MCYLSLHKLLGLRLLLFDFRFKLILFRWRHDNRFYDIIEFTFEENSWLRRKVQFFKNLILPVLHQLLELFEVAFLAIIFFIRTLSSFCQQTEHWVCSTEVKDKQSIYCIILKLNWDGKGCQLLSDIAFSNSAN